jgi:hypothetical protein
MPPRVNKAGELPPAVHGVIRWARSFGFPELHQSDLSAWRVPDGSYRVIGASAAIRLSLEHRYQNPRWSEGMHPEDVYIIEQVTDFEHTMWEDTSHREYHQVLYQIRGERLPDTLLIIPTLNVRRKWPPKESIPRNAGPVFTPSRAEVTLSKAKDKSARQDFELTWAKRPRG